MTSAGTTLLLVGALTFAGLAFGDTFGANDPALIASAACGTNPWCLSATPGVDPNSGDTTLEWTMNSAKISSWSVNGWVEAKSGSTVEDYLDFVGGNEIFEYCVNAFCSANDAGAPSSVGTILATFTWTSGSGGSFQPTSGQPGYGSNYPLSPPGQATFGVFDNGSTSGSSITDKDAAVPEPSSVLLFGSVLLIAGRAIRRRVRSAR